MWENASEIIFGLAVFVIIFIWTLIRYYSNTKGEYRRSFIGLMKELLNSIVWLGRNEVKYPKKDQLQPEKENE